MDDSDGSSTGGSGENWGIFEYGAQGNMPWGGSEVGRKEGESGISHTLRALTWWFQWLRRGTPTDRLKREIGALRETQEVERSHGTRKRKGSRGVRNSGEGSGPEIEMRGHQLTGGTGPLRYRSKEEEEAAAEPEKWLEEEETRRQRVWKTRDKHSKGAEVNMSLSAEKLDEHRDLPGDDHRGPEQLHRGCGTGGRWGCKEEGQVRKWTWCMSGTCHVFWLPHTLRILGLFLGDFPTLSLMSLR